MRDTRSPSGTLSGSTIHRIIHNAHINHRDTVIGRYTYRIKRNSRVIIRCLTEDVDRQWITHDGDIVSGWVDVCTF